MQENKKQKNKKIKVEIKNMGVNIDKNEYKEIVLSQSNCPDKNFYKNFN